MAALALKMTDAGLAAVQGASGSDPVRISQLALTATPFDYAPTLTGLPGEFKRVAIEAGVAAAPNITHLTAYDTSADDWEATGFGLFIDDGTLFAVYTGTEPFMSKARVAFALLAFDIAFQADLAANITYGNATFAYPPATEQTRGVARLASQARVNDANDGADDGETIVTPWTLRRRLAALMAAITGAIGAEAATRSEADAGLTNAIAAEATTRANADTGLNNAIAAEATTRANADTGLNNAIAAEVATRGNADTGLQTQVDALRGRSISGGGLVSGGGDLSQSRTLTVSEALPEDVTAGTAADKVITPRRLGPISMLLQQNGFLRFFGFQIAWGRFTANPNNLTAVLFAQEFSSACFSAVVSGVVNAGSGSQDNPPAVVVSTITKTGFSVYSADDEADVTCYIAVGF